MIIRHATFVLTAFLLITITSCQNKKEGAADEEYISEEKEVEGEYVEDYWNQGEINEFVVHAAMVDKMQIRIGEMALEKAVNEEVRNYGNLIKQDHTNSLNTLQKIMEERSMNIPDTLAENFNQKILELQNASGAEFDRIFLDMMIKDHKKEIAKYENAKAHIPKDKRLNEWVDNSIPALHRHEQKAKQLQNALEQD